MVKSIIKEIMILLLLLAIVVLALGIIFYNYVPSNKAVPTVQTYEMSEEVKNELNEKVAENDKVLVTYELTSNDLKTYEKTKQYTKGKSNPFSTFDTSKPKSGDENNVTDTQETSTSTQTNTSNTFYGNTGTK